MASSNSPIPESINNTLMNLQPRNNYFHQNSNHQPTFPPASRPSPSDQTPGVQIPSNSVINLSNSSDVVIGPMTQYQGAVTIYQYMDATVEARSEYTNCKL